MIFIIGPLALDPEVYWKNILKNSTDQIIALDGGIDHLLKYDIFPDIWIGDMDSSSQSSQEKMKNAPTKILTYPKEKDFSDFESAIDLLKKQSPTKLELYGMLGGRLDHMLFNLEVAKILLGLSWELKFCSFHLDAYLTCGKTSLAIASKPCQIISLLPLDSKAYIAESSGLKFPLHQEWLFSENSRGLSNVCSETEVKLTIYEGKLVVLHYKEDLS